jgi:hypothetical protein
MDSFQHTRFVDRKAEQLHELTREANAITTPPIGMEWASAAQLRSRWSSLGTAARTQVLEQFKTKEDPEGARSLLKVLRNRNG